MVLITIIGAIFIIYPNIACLPWEFGFIKGTALTHHLIYFTFRYMFFCGLIFGLIKINMTKFGSLSFKRRLFYNTLINLVAYLVFISITLLLYPKGSHLGSILIFQFFIVCFLSTFMGHIYYMYSVQRKKEQEIELLKTQNLQSRYDALKNQINPHFFFNSLNGLTALIRKKDDNNTLTYVNKMSDVFRYILQSDKKGLVTVEDELEFGKAFFYMLEVRFANKLEYKVEVDQEMLSCRLPVLSILPLIENVVAHNRIDSEYKMIISVRQTGENELVVSNPMYPKLSVSESNGTGLTNLDNRFFLLMNKHIRIEEKDNVYNVYLPLSCN